MVALQKTSYENGTRYHLSFSSLWEGSRTGPCGGGFGGQHRLFLRYLRRRMRHDARCDPTAPACSPYIIPPQIADLCPSCTGYGLVPEPASWMMLLLGVAGLGVTLRSQKRAPSQA